MLNPGRRVNAALMPSLPTLRTRLDGVTVRRATPGLNADFMFQRPLHVAEGYRLDIDKPLAEALLKLSADSPVLEAMRSSMRRTWTPVQWLHASSS